MSLISGDPQRELNAMFEVMLVVCCPDAKMGRNPPEWVRPGGLVEHKPELIQCTVLASNRWTSCLAFTPRVRHRD